jgi:hypothetical protein
MSFTSDKRKLLDEALPLQIRASHARSCALRIAEKLGINREKVIEAINLRTGVDLNNPARADDLLVAIKFMEELRRNV